MVKKILKPGLMYEYSLDETQYRFFNASFGSVTVDISALKLRPQQVCHLLSLAAHVSESLKKTAMCKGRIRAPHERERPVRAGVRRQRITIRRKRPNGIMALHQLYLQLTF